MSAATEPWQFPTDRVVESHRQRIDPDYPVQPFDVECWFTDDDAPSLTVWVNGTETIQPRDAMLHAADILTATCEPDYLVLSYDTHMASSPINPTTGKPWGEHEMQGLCDDQGFCDTGQIRDNLVVNVLRCSDASIYMHCVPYHVADGKVQYFPDESVMSEWAGDDPSYDARFQGLIPDSLRRSVRRAPLAARLEQEVGVSLADFQMTPDQERMQRIMAAMRILAITAANSNAPELYQAVVMTKNAEQGEILAESARRGGFNLTDLAEDSS